MTRINSQNYEAANDAFDDQWADDFIVSPGETWTIQQVFVQGGYFTGSTGTAFSVNVFFYHPSGSFPGVAVPGGTFLDVAIQDMSGDFMITLPTPTVLTEGVYWVSVQANMNFATSGQWGWNNFDFPILSPAAWQNPGGGFATPCTIWGTSKTCFSSPDTDASFALLGTTVGGPTPTPSPAATPSPTPTPTPPSPFNPNNILVSIGNSGAAANWVREFTVAGSLVQTFLIDYNEVSYPATERLRDLVVYQPGTIATFNGTFEPFLTRLSSVSGIINHTPFVGWSTSNTGHYGRLAAYQDFVFAADQQTGGNGSPNGIVRFDTLNNTITRFITGTDFIDVSMGLDGNLYARTHGFASTLRVYNPITMALVREIPLPSSIIGGSGIWGVAVDQMGRLFVCNGTQNVYRLHPNGALETSNATGLPGLADVNIDETGRLVVASNQGTRIAIGNSEFSSAFFLFEVTTGLPGSNFSLFVSFARPVSAAFPPPTPSPTPTPVGTVTPTPTPTPIPTPTPTLTPTPTPTPAPSVTPAAQALNLSTRMRVQTGDNVGIGGFIISGTASKNVLVRAIGPSLTQFGVPSALPDPVLELHGPAGFVTITSNNWRDDPIQEALIAGTGLAPSDNLESAIHANLSPAAYTAVVRGNDNSTGVALIEVYDLGLAVPAKLANISTRAFVGTGNEIVIAGFILGNNSGNDRIVLRGIGPSLTQFGVPDALADPTLELRDNNGALLVGNNNWEDDPAQAAELTAAGLAPSNSLESGIAATLPPGAYTALLAGFNNGTGNGVVEVYDRGSP